MAKDVHAQSVPLPKFPLSAFDLGYSLKTMCAFGEMNCHYVEEVLPGDIAHIKTDIFCRLDPLTFPIMHKVKVRQNFFFVPSRLILGDSLQEEFFSLNDMGAKLPTFTGNGTAAVSMLDTNTLFDQMECQPVSNGQGKVIRNPIPFFSYQKIFIDYYADEVLHRTLIDGLEGALADYRAVGLNGNMDSDDHPAGAALMQKRRVSFSKDRFTSAQPDAQRVGEVYLMNPLTTEWADGFTGTQGTPNQVLRRADGQLRANGDDGNTHSIRLPLTIDELWDEMAVQRLLNSMNEFGNERYIEILAGQFGVISADARLQRSQWLGGNEMVVNISEVLQTSETTSASPLGALAGRGIVSGRGKDISFKVPEHGYVLGILTFVPENGYASGSPRWLYKSTPLDFALPRLNNLGEQAVYTGELFSDHLGVGTGDLNEFGYQPQYDEYRSHVSRSTGNFRDTQYLSWHLDRKFTQAPSLNASFIEIDPSWANRIFNNGLGLAHIQTHCFHKAMYVRPISRHPIPGKL